MIQSGCVICMERMMRDSLAFGIWTSISAVERGGRRPHGEAQRHHPLACVREAIGEGAEAVRRIEGWPTCLPVGFDAQDS